MAGNIKRVRAQLRFESDELERRLLVDFTWNKDADREHTLALELEEAEELARTLLKRGAELRRWRDGSEGVTRS